MNKYMLISVIDREILTEQFGSKQEALCAMKNEMSEAGVPDEILKRDKYDDGNYGFGEDGGYVTDGPNHVNYDWRIVIL